MKDEQLLMTENFSTIFNFNPPFVKEFLWRKELPKILDMAMTGCLPC